MSKRYNGFWLTHKALRAMLYDAAMALQQTDAATAAPDTVTKKLENVLQAFDLHADLEDEYILPLVAKTHPGLYAGFEREHHQDHTLTAALREQVLAWKQSAAPDPVVFESLFYAFNDFLSFNIGHMNREETILLEAIWEARTDNALLELHAEIIRTRQPFEREQSIHWMLKGCSAGEIAQILGTAQQQLAAPAYEQFFIYAKETVGDSRWARIGAKLAV